MAETTALGWQGVRQIIKQWIAAHDSSLRSLAVAAGIQSSVISRFLRGGKLETASAVKLYTILHPTLPATDKQLFLQATGLESLQEAINHDLLSVGSLPTRPYEEDTTSPTWEQARHILKQWMGTHERSMRSVAAQVGVQPSVISRFLSGETTLEAGTSVKLYTLLHKDVPAEEKQTFLKATQLLPLISTFSNSFRTEMNLELAPYEVVNHCISVARSLQGKYLYKEAIPLFQKAESIAGVVPQAAQIACRIALLYAELGDYDRAEAEVKRVSDTYVSVVDIRTQVEMSKILGWVEYYRGNLYESERLFQQCWSIAQESDFANIAEAAPHFLGIIYSKLGRTYAQRGQTLQMARFFQAAEANFDRAYQTHARWGDDYRAFDLFRKSQLLQLQGHREAAQAIRNKARQMFKSEDDLAFLKTDLEEARLAIIDGELPRRKVEAVLSRWAEVQHPKEVAETLEVLGDLEYVQGKLHEALRLYIAALCTYPLENQFHNRRLWSEIEDACFDIIRREGQRTFDRLVHTIQEAARDHQGCFSYLTMAGVEHATVIEQVLSQLEHLGFISARLDIKGL